ncbi:hypothetical protein [Pedobacter agri]|uniref:Secreted protein n=1 Tax=Pedobacter agri TaxID=454586 RepID=A0A9X3DG93_9SPHI|nr:hypothetical protein [Pedobacter agri]MCX3266536.1 hypothetical protein [Pedobacter agri]
MSIPFKIFATLVVLACCAINCFGQTGCFVPVAGSAGRSTVDRIYTNPQSGEPPGKFYTTAVSYTATCPPGASASTTYAVNISDVVPGTGCWVDYKNDGSPTQYPNNYYQNGKLVNFRVANCPIDDYISLMLVGLAGIGFVMVRRVTLV